jgi:hypothetical protein
MTEISEAALEAARHMGYVERGFNYHEAPNGAWCHNNDLPRPDEDPGDCMRYLLFVLSYISGADRVHVGYLVDYGDYKSIELCASGPDVDDFTWSASDSNALSAITAACNMAMRAVTESEAGK